MPLPPGLKLSSTSHLPQNLPCLLLFRTSGFLPLSNISHGLPSQHFCAGDPLVLADSFHSLTSFNQALLLYQKTLLLLLLLNRLQSCPTLCLPHSVFCLCFQLKNILGRFSVLCLFAVQQNDWSFIFIYNSFCIPFHYSLSQGLNTVPRYYSRNLLLSILYMVSSHPQTLNAPSPPPSPLATTSSPLFSSVSVYWCSLHILISYQ